MLVNAAHVILLTDIFISGKLVIKFIKCFNVIFVCLYKFFSLLLLIIIQLSLGLIMARVITLQGEWFAKVKSACIVFKKNWAKIISVRH